VKRAELERWLRSHGAEPVPGRSRGGHEAWRHAETGAKSFVPRHREIGVG
jgi:predicted RNA binding protein YcfA (HicA-like mRNA interferase family)